MLKKINCLCLLLILSGCAATKNVELEYSSLEKTPQKVNWKSSFFELVDVPSESEIFSLSEDNRNHFLDYYYAHDDIAVAGHKHLYQYIDNFLDGFDYKGKTYNADLAATKRAGNCLSLAILTKAYASLVGLDVEFRKVNSAPIYQRNSGVMTISSHIQTHLYAPEVKLEDKSFLKVLRSKIIIDYFPSSNSFLGDRVSDADFSAMYYQNLAAEAIIAGNFDLAYSLLFAAMELSLNNTETLNTLAVLYKITGNTLLAETLYLNGIENGNNSVSLLSNYILLLEETNRPKEAALMKQKFKDLRDDNPYRWYDLANQAYVKQNFSEALKYYEKSIQVAPYLHESFFGQAKTYARLGKKHQAKIAIKKAVSLAFKPSDEKLYLAKLNSLTSVNQL